MIRKSVHASHLEEHYGKDILPLSVLENSVCPGSEPMEILIYYKKATSVEKLKGSLLKAVEHYNLFSSRLIMTGRDEFALQYCTDGVEINVLPPLDVAFDGINIDEIKKIMVHVKTLPGEPLLVATGIPIKDGILGAISCSHAIGDGISLMLFLFTWSCIVEDKNFPLPSPQRLFKGKPSYYDRIDKVFLPPLSALNQQVRDRLERAGKTKKYSTKENFSDDYLTDIKNQARLENNEVIISDNQIITAFLLKKYHDIILPDAGRIIVRVPVNIREIHPGIDALYIGNAYFDSVTEFAGKEIEKMPVTHVAYRLKESIMHSRKESFVKQIAYLSEYGIEFRPEMLQKYPPYNAETDIVSSNLTHLGDLESLGLGSNIGSLLNISPPAQTSFTILKEKNGSTFAQITSNYPLS